MEYTVCPTDLANISLIENDEVNAIMRNVALILATPKGSVPMYRDFGLDTSFLDKPMNIARNAAVIPVREAIETWEPRATFQSIELSQAGQDGRLSFSVTIEINGSDMLNAV